jgi:peptide subunit release factor 1 (eRF1)
LNNAAVFVLFQPTAGEVIGIALGTPSDTDGSNLTYVAPDVKEEALPFGDLSPGESQGIWIRRQVEAGQNTFETSSFQLAAFGYGSTL